MAECLTIMNDLSIIVQLRRGTQLYFRASWEREKDRFDSSTVWVGLIGVVVGKFSRVLSCFVSERVRWKEVIPSLAGESD
jgi:hypothetical protein